ncbi:MAG: hypothetical protein QOD92_4337 [Acidimicrobiaceae bacterium]|jgi:predicted enzyme related to lactoylglutathione lyase
MAARITTTVFDAAHPAQLGEFWAEVLGWDTTTVDGHDDWVVIADPNHEATFILLFLPGSETKTAKNRVHLDINPVGCSQQEELERLLSLGARRVDIGQGEQTWFVLADPEGNEFCLLRNRVE